MAVPGSGACRTPGVAVGPWHGHGPPAQSLDPQHSHGTPSTVTGPPAWLRDTRHGHSPPALPWDPPASPSCCPMGGSAPPPAPSPMAHRCRAGGCEGPWAGVCHPLPLLGPAAPHSCCPSCWVRVPRGAMGECAPPCRVPRLRQEAGCPVGVPGPLSPCLRAVGRMSEVSPRVPWLPPGAGPPLPTQFLPLMCQAAPLGPLCRAPRGGAVPLGPSPGGGARAKGGYPGETGWNQGVTRAISGVGGSRGDPQSGAGVPGEVGTGTPGAGGGVQVVTGTPGQGDRDALGVRDLSWGGGVCVRGSPGPWLGVRQRFTGGGGGPARGPRSRRETAPGPGCRRFLPAAGGSGGRGAASRAGTAGGAGGRAARGGVPQGPPKGGTLPRGPPRNPLQGPPHGGGAGGDGLGEGQRLRPRDSSRRGVGGPVPPLPGVGVADCPPAPRTFPRPPAGSVPPSPAPPSSPGAGHACPSPQSAETIGCPSPKGGEGGDSALGQPGGLGGGSGLVPPHGPAPAPRPPPRPTARPLPVPAARPCPAPPHACPPRGGRGDSGSRQGSDRPSWAGLGRA